MLHPRDLSVFCQVAETGNMSRVAEAESKTVMAISKQIARLESELNQALFIRTRRKLVLTEFGAKFKKKSEAFLEHYKELVHWRETSESSVTGELRVVCQANDIVNETLVPWMAEFTAKYPELGIALDVKESVIDIIDDDYDVFWAVGDYLGQRYPGLKRKALWASTYGIFASPDYLKKMGTPKTVADLERHKVIGYLHNQPSNVLIARGADGQPQYVTPNCQIKTVAGHLELAEAGLGLINLPVNTAAMQEIIKQGRLCPVLQDDWWEGAEVYVYYHPSRPIQAKIRAFLDFFIAKRHEWEF
ncbi:LysR family transcriptional regulator [Pseudidiomarina sp. 1APP75-27a]|uniref:LysR family transcriptional regulator n=1 Tax=Pseudidiomarina terrestris TaxID=2820060 RepID=UPI0026545D7F|nr:LysR family transcriptional regulator [Pseudidiomarina sp. 1ASP75-14]MDN7137580.1 LysR family transcriptional regulator [Pseudidiomarina sp. 1ASP75-14]MEA3587310.1 LysR family transcriptional regulator [Pseudidiomarina sp. 1APP75-27a]